MARFAYWDTVLVIDDELPEDLINRKIKEKPSTNEMVNGSIVGSDPSKTSYLTRNNSNASDLFDEISAMGVIPILEDHDVTWHSNFHSLSRGSKMDWHTDSGKSIAMTLYLGSCCGGDLHIKAPCKTQSVIISPRRNRLIVMKANTLHSVSEVESGVRDSIQFFITYRRKE